TPSTTWGTSTLRPLKPHSLALTTWIQSATGGLVQRHEAGRVEGVEEEVASAVHHTPQASRVVGIAVAVLSQPPQPESRPQKDDDGQTQPRPPPAGRAQPRPVRRIRARWCRRRRYAA